MSMIALGTHPRSGRNGHEMPTGPWAGAGSVNKDARHG